MRYAASFMEARLAVVRPSPHSLWFIVAVIAFMVGGLLCVYAFVLGGQRAWVVALGAVVAAASWASLWWLAATREPDG